MLVYPASKADVSPPITMQPKSRAKKMEDGLISWGRRRRRDSTQEVFVTRGMVKRFAVASSRKALRIVEPLVLGSGVMGGFVAGDLECAILIVGWVVLFVVLYRG